MASPVLSHQFRCVNPSKYAGWITAVGEFVPARCGATNRCAYCAYLAVVENALVVALDAEAGGYPRVGATLTTADPVHNPAEFRVAVADVFKALRRSLGTVEYLGFMEWTTGKAARSGGKRRAHQHVLLKGVDHDQAPVVEALLRRHWRLGSQVEARPLRSVAGATAYLVHHHNKASQAPPAGYSGKRLRPSRGYYARPVAELRRTAHELLVSKRLRKAARRSIVWEALDGAPEELVDAELRAAIAQARREHEMVTFVRLDHRGGILPPREWRGERDDAGTRVVTAARKGYRAA
jgi:hypothetical protein